MTNGLIELEEMAFHAYHGCLESERKNGNLFLVDFRGELDLSIASENDCLDDTVNYAVIYEIIKSQMETSSDLLEHVAGRIVKEIATAFPQFIRFSVRVSKKNPPVGGPVAWSRVTLNHGL